MELLGPLIEHAGMLLTAEEVALIQLYEKMSVKKTFLSTSTNETSDGLRNKKRGRALPPAPPKNIPKAPRIDAQRGPTMFDRLMGQDSQVSSIDPSTTAANQLKYQETGAAAAIESRSEEGDVKNSAGPAKTRVSMPLKSNAQRAVPTSSTSTGTVSSTTGTIKRKPRLPVANRNSQSSSSQISAFERGERHANLPSENFAWTGPDWMSEMADDNLDVVIAPMDEMHDVLLINCTIPKDSNKFAVNICPENHDCDQVYFHFNPRQFERGGNLVIDSKIDGDWVRPDRMSLGRFPQLFGLTEAQLALHITPQGIRVACNGSHFVSYMFRDQLLLAMAAANNPKLAVNIPTCDDGGDPTRITLHSVWWGSMKSLKGGGGRGGMKPWKGHPWNCGNESFNVLNSNARAMHVSYLPRYPEGSSEAKMLKMSLEKMLRDKECNEVSHIEVTASRGIAAVTFERPQALVSALAKLSNASLNGQRIRVDVLKTRS